MLILCLTGGIAGIDMLAINFLGPFVVADMRLDNAHFGSIGAIMLSSWSVGAIVAALLSDRIGRRKPFLIGALVAFAVFSFATALATSFATLVAARLLVGLAEGPVVPMQNTIMYAASSEGRRGLNIGIVQNFGSQLLGALGGPIILVWIAIHFGGWRNAFMLAGAPALVMAVIVHFTIREVRPDAAAPRAAPAPLGRTIGEIARVHNIRVCFLVGICAISWFGSMLTFLPLWAVRVLHFSPSEMSLMVGCLGAAGAVGSVIVPAIADRFGRRPAMAIFALFGMIVPLGLLFGPTGLVPVCAIVFTGSLFMGIFPLFIGVVPMESVAARNGATALAVVMGCAQIISGVVGPMLGGIMADIWSIRAPLWMACGMSAAAALFATRIHETLRVRQFRGSSPSSGHVNTLESEQS